MLKRIGWAGLIGGLIPGLVLLISMIAWQGVPLNENKYGMLIGYASMLIALSFVFVAIKQHRDRALGGVIKFLPAFGMGIAISVIAALIYAAAWEVTLAITGLDFGQSYMDATLAEMARNGASEDAMSTTRAGMESFVVMYRNPLFRFPMTMTEILPVGLLVSLVSALLLRNARFMPARTVAA